MSIGNLKNMHAGANVGRTKTAVYLSSLEGIYTNEIIREDGRQSIYFISEKRRIKMNGIINNFRYLFVCFDTCNNFQRALNHHVPLESWEM